MRITRSDRIPQPDPQPKAQGPSEADSPPQTPPPRRKKRFSVSTLLLVLVFAIGLCLLLYPSVSELVNERNHSRVIARHQEALEQMDETDLQELWDLAIQYNADLAESPKEWYLTEYERGIYNNILNPFGNGTMGYLEIPSIEVRLPIYHSVEEEVLQVGVGHIESSSLPVGGESSHCILSGHRGLPSSRLLTDIDQLEEGDVFYLHVLNETLAYTVDNIRVVEPQNVESLGIEQGKDYCTLVTCTPYGVNTHRLLVRGIRTPYTPTEEEAAAVTATPVLQKTINYIPFAVALLLILLLAVLLIRNHKKSRTER